MPYLHSTLVEEEARGDWFVGRHFTEDERARIVRTEVWCSSFSDPGEDYSILKAFDDADQLIREVRVPGY